MKVIKQKVLALALIGSIITTTYTNQAIAMKQQLHDEVSHDLNVVSLGDWEEKPIGEYPIDVTFDEWEKMSSTETATACDMPLEYAKNLTTEELVDYAINYPFLIDVLAFDELGDGMQHLEEKSGLFKELFSRKDVNESLIDKYTNLDIDYVTLEKSDDIIGTNYDAAMFIEEYIGLNYDSLTKKQKENFVGEYGDNFEEMSQELQDSDLTTIFYDAVEESMGEIPKDAIPDNVADKLIKATDKNGAAFTIIAAWKCPSCGENALEGLLEVHSKQVRAYKWVGGGYTKDDIEKLDKATAKIYPTYTKVSSASSKYNCHSYAWYYESEKNIYWINDPKNIYNNTNYWKLWKKTMRDIKSGDRITFWKNGSIQHSAIVNSSKKCTSKLGHLGVYKTTISEMKNMYGSTTSAYIPK